MSKWKATMPLYKPPIGKVQMVVAIKENSGARSELSGEFSTMKAKLIARLMCMTDEQIEQEVKGGAQ